jgi:cystathionine beta-lyase
MPEAAMELNGNQIEEDHIPDDGMGRLSLSSKTIHADDFLNQGQDVAPPLHVSTTFRYNKDPDKLKMWNQRGVSRLLLH